jgi:peroxiredoxin
MRMRWKMVLILILLGGAMAGAQIPKAGYDLIARAARQAAPDFSLTDVQGRAVSLAQFRGKVVLLDFWAVDCGGCKLEIPWYVEFDRKYRAKGLQLVGLDMYGETPEKISAFMAKSGMDYPVAVGSDALGSRFGLEEMPLTLLIDREGRVALRHAGVVDRDAFEHAIEELLQ